MVEAVCPGVLSLSEAQGAAYSQAVISSSFPVASLSEQLPASSLQVVSSSYSRTVATAILSEQVTAVVFVAGVVAVVGMVVEELLPLVGDFPSIQRCQSSLLAVYPRQFPRQTRCR